ncbi:MAG: peptidase M48 [Lysobacterales bacterium CG02_land_8_20_14_3_00_62_12]|nr:MAG: peptidase M48 [Xanthomonadales bacterium CG02_land_8_20_14_3_00_62_12]
MNDLVYPRERTLGAITLVLGLLAWLALLVGTFGIALIGLALGFILYLFAQSAFIAYIKGNGVELSEAQFPDLYGQFTACCDRLQIDKRPQAYILNGNGGLNAFATKFLGTQFVVLMSDVVDAMSKHTDGVRFYLGHELGHLRMKHLSGHLLRWPVLWLPLLGAAYSRARESTCDRHGLACSSSPEGAVRALAALAAGGERWVDLDVTAYLRQAQHSSGFWMSFHELIAGYPWLTKRAARVFDRNAPMPRRNRFALAIAIFIPYAGRLGAGFGVAVMLYLLFILGAIAYPAYRDYVVRAKVGIAVVATQPALDLLGDHYETHKAVPDSLKDVGIPTLLAGGGELTLDSKNMALTASIKEGEIVFTPTVDDQGKVNWTCANGKGVKPTQLPPTCRNMGR